MYSRSPASDLDTPVRQAQIVVDRESILAGIINAIVGVIAPGVLSDTIAATELNPVVPVAVSLRFHGDPTSRREHSRNLLRLGPRKPYDELYGLICLAAQRDEYARSASAEQHEDGHDADDLSKAFEEVH